jgi:endonuclease/exonuclease/phosphatase family metal-dependent hydrolase
LKKLTLVSFNAGLLNLSACGRTILEPAPHTEERLKHVAKALAELDADIILLQEVYRKDHCERIIRELGYPYAIQSRDRFLLRSGLMVLSKYPLQGNYIPFSERLIEDRIADKGMIAARALTPEGSVAIVNVHPTAGGRLHPEHPQVEHVRSAQLTQAMEELTRLGDIANVLILAGDFNTGPEASPGNFQEMLDQGYRDTFRANGAYRFTWDPNNPLNAQGPHAHCPPQRCDHVLIKGEVAEAKTDIVLTDPVVNVPNGTCTVSDHYGLLSTITF